MQRDQQQVVTYLIEENRVLKAQRRGRHLLLTDTDRRRLAALAHPISRKRLKDVTTIATPDMLMRWYKRLTLNLSQFVEAQNVRKNGGKS
jgi:hypothetical protein